jgi:polyhydroxybutyrate depolymerase
MGFKSLFFCFLILAVFHFNPLSPNLYAQEKSRGLKERIKQRWIKKQESKPAPILSQLNPGKIQKTGDYTFGLMSGGIQRYYKLHIPKKYNPELLTPLILALHGGGGDMEIQSKDEYYQLISKSDKEGFLIAFPNGYSSLKSGKFATWNAGKCCGDARDKKIDDVSFLKSVVEDLKSKVNVDSNLVFAIGMSNGGMMAYRLACEASDTFKAIASVTGTDGTEICKPKHPISILHIHAKDDDHVLFNGGAGKNAFKDKSKVTEFDSVPNVILKWVKLNACNIKPNRTLEKPKAFCEDYTCPNPVKVQLCVTDDGGHSWPGGKKPRGNGKASKAIDANSVIWEFFKNLGSKE